MKVLAANRGGPESDVLSKRAHEAAKALMGKERDDLNRDTLKGVLRNLEQAKKKNTDSKLADFLMASACKTLAFQFKDDDIDSSLYFAQEAVRRFEQTDHTEDARPLRVLISSRAPPVSVQPQTQPAVPGIRPPQAPATETSAPPPGQAPPAATTSPPPVDLPPSPPPTRVESAQAKVSGELVMPSKPSIESRPWAALWKKDSRSLAASCMNGAESLRTMAGKTKGSVVNFVFQYRQFPPETTSVLQDYLKACAGADTLARISQSAEDFEDEGSIAAVEASVDIRVSEVSAKLADQIKTSQSRDELGSMLDSEEQELIRRLPETFVSSKLLVPLRSKVMDLLNGKSKRYSLTFSDLKDAEVDTTEEVAKRVFLSFKDGVEVGRMRYLSEGEYGLSLENPRISREVTRVIDDLRQKQLPDAVQPRLFYLIMSDVRCDFLANGEYQDLLAALLDAAARTHWDIAVDAAAQVPLQQLAWCENRLYDLASEPNVARANRAECRRLFRETVTRVPSVVVEMSNLGESNKISSRSVEAAAEVIAEEQMDETPRRVLASLLESREHSNAPTKSDYLYLAEFSEPVLQFKAKVMSHVDYILKHAGDDFEDAADEYKSVRAYLHFVPIESQYYSRVKMLTRSRGLLSLVATFSFFFLMGKFGPPYVSQALFVIMAILLPVVSKLSTLTRLTWMNPDIYGKRLSLGGTLAMVSLSGSSVFGGGGSSILSGSHLSPVALVDLVLLVWILYSGIDLVYRITRSFFPPTEESVDLASQVVSYSTTGVIAYTSGQLGLLSGALFLPLGDTTTLAAFGGLSIAILVLRRRWSSGVEKDETSYVKKKTMESQLVLYKSMTNALLEKSVEVHNRDVYAALKEEEVPIERTKDLALKAFKTLEEEGRGYVMGEGTNIKFRRSEGGGQPTSVQEGVRPKVTEQETPQLWLQRLKEASGKGGSVDITGRLSMQAYGEPWYQSLLQSVLLTDLSEEQLKAVLFPTGAGSAGGLAAKQIALTCSLRQENKIRLDVADPEEKEVRELVRAYLCRGVTPDKRADQTSSLLTYKLELGGASPTVITLEIVRGPEGDPRSTTVALANSAS